MFTGIVQTLGTVEDAVAEADLLRLRITSPGAAAGLAVGDSVAVDGVCLTATRIAAPAFEVEAMGETLGRTTLGGLRAGAVVNLELAARLVDRLGGHLVQGHVDGVGEVAGLERSPDRVTVRVRCAPDVLRYVVPKGSVAVDGVSLTVVEVGEDWFSLSLIPHTLEVTTLGRLEPSARVNIEVDVIAKYVERFVVSGRN